MSDEASSGGIWALIKTLGARDEVANSSLHRSSMGRKSRKKQKTRAQRNSAGSPGWESATDRNDLMSGGEGSNSNRDSRQSSPGAVDRTDDQAIASKISSRYHKRTIATLILIEYGRWG